MNKHKELTELEIENLMLETLAYDGEDIDIDKKNFPLYGYMGTQSDLFRLMDNLAVKKGIIEQKIKQCRFAWGSNGHRLIGLLTTNFTNLEINKIYEAFNVLMSRGIIAPGGARFYGPNLPAFHVTDYGIKCLGAKEILPYDSNEYLAKLNKIEGLDEWIEYYIKQALECYNSYCYEASLIMLGLANEQLLNIVIKSYLSYLNAKDSMYYESINAKIIKKHTISEKFSIYLESLKEQRKKDEQLKGLSKYLDELATVTFQTYVRLTRNELAHPNQLKIDRITTLMIFISFVEYCNRQYKFINYFNPNINIVSLGQ